MLNRVKKITEVVLEHDFADMAIKAFATCQMYSIIGTRIRNGNEGFIHGPKQTLIGNYLAKIPNFLSFPERPHYGIFAPRNDKADDRFRLDLNNLVR
uniref:Uncharacterized protein n=1 Tax=Romanomermis culicivorax TaxID=13658 RepID=A0A915IH99_ROMCU